MPARTVRRALHLSRVLRPGAAAMPADFPTVHDVKGAAEAVDFQFDFSPFPEFAAGETLASVSVPAVTGLTLSTSAPSVTTERTDGVAAGKGAVVRVSGGTAGTTYTVSARGTFSGGSVREVRLALTVR